MRNICYAAFLPFFLAGCSTLPSAGPTTRDVIRRAVVDDVSRYSILDVSGPVIDVLSRRTQDSLSATFGDYRPALDPRIGIGDTVAVTVWEAAAGGLFSAPMLSDRFSTGSKSATIPEQVVGRDGSISIPYAGRIKVTGQSPTQVQETIEKALAGKAIQPQILVNVIRPFSSSVTVTGEVTNGARVPLSVKGDRLMDVIAAAGGLRAPVNETFIQISRGERSVRVAMARVVADPRENIFMRPDDVITLVREPQTFVAYGATGRNAEIPFDADGISLAQALAKAGGLLDFRADAEGVFILRYEPVSLASRLVNLDTATLVGNRAPIVYRLNLRDPNGLFLAQQFRIFPKDVLYASNASLSDAEKVFQAIGFLTGQVGTASSLRAAAR